MAIVTDPTAPPALPHGWTREAAHGALVRLLPSELAAIFAVPVPGGWRLPDGEARRFYDLDAASRDALLAELGRAVSEIRRTGERLGGGDAELLAAAVAIPGFDAVWAVAGRPVLAGWGQGSTALLHRWDDGVPWTKPPSPPWGVWFAAAAALLLLMAAAPFLAKLLPLDATAPACGVESDQLGALARLTEERERGRRLEGELASLRQEIGLRRLACALPAAPPPQQARTDPPPADSEPPPLPQSKPPPPDRPEPPPPPPPRAEPAPPPRMTEDQSRVAERGGRSGRVQIILAWDDINDLDLKVVCPSGEVIWARRKIACGGGRLDVDANCCQGQFLQDRPVPNPVENVVWVDDAPTGRYRVIVDYYSRRRPPVSPYRVTVLVDGKPRHHVEGALREGEHDRSVLQFDLP